MAIMTSGSKITDASQIAADIILNSHINSAAAIAGSKLASDWQKDVASGLPGLNASLRVHPNRLPNRQFSSFWTAHIDNKIDGNGTFTFAANINQTDFDSDLCSSAGVIQTTAGVADGNYMYFESPVMNAGTYLVKISSIKSAAAGILKVDLGTLNILTFDLYSAATVYNATASASFTLTTRQAGGSVIVKVSGKNASSSDYYIYCSRLEFIRTG